MVYSLPLVIALRCISKLPSPFISTPPSAGSILPSPFISAGSMDTITPSTKSWSDPNLPLQGQYYHRHLYLQGQWIQLLHPPRAGLTLAATQSVFHRV